MLRSMFLAVACIVCVFLLPLSFASACADSQAPDHPQCKASGWIEKM